MRTDRCRDGRATARRAGVLALALSGCHSAGAHDDGFEAAGLSTGGLDTDGDAAGSSDNGDDGSDDGSDGGDTGGLGELCDGFDNDADGDVDETCSCTPGDVQDCFAGPPEAFLECRGTTQQCEGAGSEVGWSWGHCGGLCDDATLTLDDPAGAAVWGAAAQDGFTLVGRAPLGDVDGDGELDMLAASAAGDGTAADVGVAYALYGGPCLQRHALDLATLPLDGATDDSLHGGFVVDRTIRDVALAADVDGDGRVDVVIADSANSSAVVFGSAGPDGLYDVATADGTSVTRLVDGGGSWGMSGGVTAGDFDGDGYADVFMSASNNTMPPMCPCAPNGVSVWWGRPDFAAQTQRDVLVDIGIDAIGMASLSNFSVVGGLGDFDDDGYLDLASGNGAANDEYVVAYRTFVWFGGPDRALPSTMPGVEATGGFRLVGGPGRGPHPNHQHGDFDGDGVDDLFAYAAVPYANSTSAYIVYGHPGAFDAQLDASALAGAGTVIEAGATFGPGDTMGVGDIDGDGFDDLAIALADADAGGFAIVWGRDGAGGSIDAENDPSTLIITGQPGLGPTPRLAIADVDGDGLGDVLVGAASADTQNGENSGAGFVKFGSCLAEHHNPGLVRGQDGGDALTGTGAADTIAAGRGDDVVDGAGGADVVYGGQGDDRFLLGDLGFARVHGGLGLDTVVLEGDGLDLDLRVVGRARLQEIERFELGPGAQTLTLAPGDVSALSTSTRIFTVEGDAADTVVLDGMWTPAGDPDNDGLDAYVHGALTVLVRDSVDVQG